MIRIINHAIKSVFVVTIKSMDLNKTISTVQFSLQLSRGISLFQLFSLKITKACYVFTRYFSLQLCCLDFMNGIYTRQNDF